MSLVGKLIGFGLRQVLDVAPDKVIAAVEARFRDYSQTLPRALARANDRGAGRGPSSRKGTWYVEHPANRVRLGGKRSGDVRREGSFCKCGMQLSLTGVCVNCD